MKSLEMKNSNNEKKVKFKAVDFFIFTKKF
jgi:hypothetical protein